jgi:hypothetical protein
MTEELSVKKGSFISCGKNNQLDQIIIIDRNVDFVTPFCTPLTYEGLIDHFFGIYNTLVELDPKVSGFPDVKKFALSAGKDAIFGELRNRNFSAVGNVLNGMAKAIHEHYEVK